MPRASSSENTNAPRNRVRGKAWCFTINNPTEEDIPGYDSSKHEYLVYQLEQGQGSQTPHYQGYVFFKSKVEFNTVKKWLPRAHIAKAKGTPLQNRDYCTKEMDHGFPCRLNDPVEYGELPI